METEEMIKLRKAFEEGRIIGERDLLLKIVEQKLEIKLREYLEFD
jgi:hypothetical protein